MAKPLAVKTTLTAATIMRVVRAHASSAQTKILRGFFKTARGEYAAGDRFVGVMVPTARKIAAEFRALPFDECKKLLHSSIHEARLIALFILCDQFARGDKKTRAAIYKIYLANTTHINNWDLVDASAPHIVGKFLLTQNHAPLFKLVRSKSLWERRIAIVATHTFIRAGQFQTTLQITELLLHDSHDLIHKATGWMLREIGKRDENLLKTFLAAHGVHMPRATLRYAIEKFPKATRKKYLKTF